MMETWERLLAGLPSSRVVAAAHYAIWRLRRRAEISERDLPPSAVSSVTEPSNSDKQLAWEIIHAIETDAGVPIGRMDERSTERQIVKLADYVQKATRASEGAAARADVVLDKIRFTTNISGSTIGAISVGDHAVATGTVTVGVAGLTQEQHRRALKEAQKALVDDQDTLEQIDERLFEALGQFLRLARQIQVEQQSIAQLQAKMKETLDEVWAQQVAKGMKSQALPSGLKVISTLAASPATAEVAKTLLGA